jgi:hypothetical protein
MSGTFPSDPGPSTVTLESNQPVVTDYAESGKSQTRIIGGHLWKARLSWSIVPRSVLAPLFAFINLQRGAFDSFQIVLPNYAIPNGNFSGSPLVLGGVFAGATSVLMKGAPIGVLDYIKAGDIFKFANHTKVYIATSDADSNGSGFFTLNFQPPLIEPVVIDEAAQFVDVPFTVTMTDEAAVWKGSAPNMASISIDMIESI